jgi:hypothetical protein
VFGSKWIHLTISAFSFSFTQLYITEAAQPYPILDFGLSGLLLSLR